MSLGTILPVPPRDPPEYCECIETLVDGKRVPMPLYHDCDYIAHRSSLTGMAAVITDRTHRDEKGKRLPSWEAAFARAMDQLWEERDAHPPAPPKIDENKLWALADRLNRALKRVSRQVGLAPDNVRVQNAWKNAYNVVAAADEILKPTKGQTNESDKNKDQSEED
jgi:hypothetical protein